MRRIEKKEGIEGSNGGKDIKQHSEKEGFTLWNQISWQISNLFV